MARSDVISRGVRNLGIVCVHVGGLRNCARASGWVRRGPACVGVPAGARPAQNLAEAQRRRPPAPGAPRGAPASVVGEPCARHLSCAAARRGRGGRSERRADAGARRGRASRTSFAPRSAVEELLAKSLSAEAARPARPRRHRFGRVTRDVARASVGSMLPQCGRATPTLSRAAIEELLAEPALPEAAGAGRLRRSWFGRVSLAARHRRGAGATFGLPETRWVARRARSASYSPEAVSIDPGTWLEHGE